MLVDGSNLGLTVGSPWKNTLLHNSSGTNVFRAALVNFEVSPKYTNHFKKNLSENGCETKYILYTTFFEKTSLGQWRFRRNVPSVDQ